jgi:ABC-2 type transport system permease protein
VNLQLLKARQTKYVAYAALYIVVVLAIISTANFLANRYTKTYDTTANKRYSLSEQSAKIVKGLKEDAKITYFDQGTRFERAKDQLDLYANLSPRVHVEYIDADKKPQLAREAGIKNYGTTIVQIGGKKEEAKSTSEEDITAAFIRATKSGARTICYVAGSGEHQFDDTERSGYSRLRDLLVREEYDSRPISLLQKSEVPSNCNPRSMP